MRHDHAVDGGFGANVYAIVAPGKFMAPKVRALIDYLVAAFAGSAPWHAIDTGS